MTDLTNRIALVTGGSQEIGAAAAIALAKAGADVAVNYRERADAANVVCTEISKLGQKALAVQADVSMAADIRRMLTQIESHLGCVDTGSPQEGQVAITSWSASVSSSSCLCRNSISIIGS